MSRLHFAISMSLDGYVAGPQQSVENPLGLGGEALFAGLDELGGLEQVQAVTAPGVTHLRFARSEGRP